MGERVDLPGVPMLEHDLVIPALTLPYGIYEVDVTLHSFVNNEDFYRFKRVGIHDSKLRTRYSSLCSPFKAKHYSKLCLNQAS